MTISGSGLRFFWCLQHHRVESDADACRAVDRLGPYGSVNDAERALERVQERNEAWDVEDARWAGEE